MKLIVHTLLLILIGLANNVFAQDPTFSMKSRNLLFFNPGSCGATEDIKVSLNHRDQWRAITTPFQTSTLSVEGKMSKKTHRYQKFVTGTGMYFMNDQSGSSELKVNSINVAFSAILQTSDKGLFCGGIMGGYGARSAKLKGLQWSNQYVNGSYNPGISSGEVFTFTRYSYFDVGAGIHYHYGLDPSFMRANDGVKFQFGYSIYHLGVARNSFAVDTIRSGIRQTIYGTALIGKDLTDLSLVPEIFYQRQAKFNEFQYGLGVRYLIQEESRQTGFIGAKALQAGLYHRWNDAVIVNCILMYSNYSLGISYDFNVSDLRKVSNGRGAFEIQLGFQAPDPFNYATRSRI